ncbi:hypothetical protein STCU_02161 [Strigomonas culicis]|nr:hypothetical protein STCU_02161 [Strigomonas culicis]|eukprot:EPY33552.1 hypothetical protein STCU_02161 [Strigomonas culicis]
MDTPFYNEKVFKAARVVFGRSYELLLSGGGALSAATQEFVNVVFGRLIGGWGLTETVCVGAIQRLGDLEPCCAGQVLVSEELRLADTEEYKHTDKPLPRGELCLRGPFLFKGYYKQPELTKEAIDADGWFHTGDIGSIDELGRVSIVGRIKALAKNSLGEYIALEMLESIYNTHPLVLNNCACVLVDPYKNYICLLTSGDGAQVTKFAKEHHITGADTPEGLAQLPAFRKAAGRSFAQLGHKSGLKHFECVRYVGVVLDEWTPENGLLTAAMKLKRSKVADKYEKLISDLFADE